MADEILINWEKMRISTEEEDVIPFDGLAASEIDLEPKFDRFLVGKLVNGKIANFNSLRNSLVRDWRLVGEVQIKEIGSGILAFKFSDKADRDRILHRRPWNFDNQLLLLEPVLPGISPKDVDFTNSPFWTQLWDLPTHMRNPNYAKRISDFLGRFME